jgi:ABC-2 type transport system ATP-binding protein
MQIQFQGLSKEYKSGVWGLKNVDLTIEKGVFGLLGPNGAGKTTLMRILATLLKPTSGICLVDGKDITRNGDEVRKILGYLPQEFSLYPNLTPLEFVDYMFRLKGFHDKKVVESVLEEVGLAEVKKRKISSLSGGMKRRVGIAQALIGNPQIVIVDEPTTGLDPEERVHFRSLISKFAKGRTVILSTHIIEDIYQTCENIGILQSGQVLYQGNKTELMKRVSGKVKIIKTENEEALEEIKQKAILLSVSYESDGIKARIIDEKKEYSETPERESLEDAYVYCVGGSKE